MKVLHLERAITESLDEIVEERKPAPAKGKSKKKKPSK
jgi:hypothetical protein